MERNATAVISPTSPGARAPTVLALPSRPPAIEPEALLSERSYLALRRREAAVLTALRARRRLRVSPALTLLFEGHETVLAQVYEVLRVEGWSPARLRRELAAYACLVPSPGRLCATAMIDGGGREHGLALLAALRAGGLRLTCGGLGSAAEPVDLADDDPVQYLRFAASPELAVALGAGAPARLDLDALGVRARVQLPAALRRELTCDLGGGPSSTPLLRPRAAAPRLAAATDEPA